MTSRVPYGELSPLLQVFRRDNGPANMLALHCFLLCADKPRTISELAAITGADKAGCSRAVRTLTPWFDKAKEEMVKPTHHLLRRVKINAMGEQRILLTERGRELLGGGDPKSARSCND